MAKEKSFFYKMGSGFLIGMGIVLPGISGGVLALIFGLYQPLLTVITKPFSHWQQNLRLLIPLALGVGSCLFLFGGLLKYLYIQFPLLLLYLFLGLVLGGLPAVFSLANKKGFRLSYLTSWAGGASFLILITSLSKLLPKTSLGGGLWQILGQGLLLAFGTVVPGLSASFLLMSFGVYEGVLTALMDLDLGILFPLAVGFIPGAILVSLGISYLFERVYGHTYYAILGVLVGSLLLVFPGWPRTRLEAALALGLFVGSFCFSLFLGKGLKSE